MSEQVQAAAATTEITTAGTAKIIYIMYMVGLLIPFVSLIGLIMAYVNKGTAPQWLQTHYQFQIRTFWIGFLYFVISAILMFVLIGWITFLITIVWYIVRSVKGMNSLDLRQAHPNPTGWMFS